MDFSAIPFIIMPDMGGIFVIFPLPIMSPFIMSFPAVAPIPCAKDIGPLTAMASKKTAIKTKNFLPIFSSLFAISLDEAQAERQKPFGQKARRDKNQVVYCRARDNGRQPSLQWATGLIIQRIPFLAISTLLSRLGPGISALAPVPSLPVILNPFVLSGIGDNFLKRSVERVLREFPVILQDFPANV